MSVYTVALEHQLRELSDEIDALPWWRILRRYELVDRHQSVLRLLAQLKGFIE